MCGILLWFEHLIIKHAAVKLCFWSSLIMGSNKDLVFPNCSACNGEMNQSLVIWKCSCTRSNIHVHFSVHPQCILCLQPGAESAVVDVTRRSGRGHVPVHVTVSGRLFPAVPWVVVLLRQPKHCEDPYLPACSSTPCPSAAGAQWPGHLIQWSQRHTARLRPHDMPAVPEASHKRHSAVHLRLRLLLPLHLYVRKSQPPLPAHQLPHWSATPHQDLLTRELDHIRQWHSAVQLVQVWGYKLQTFRLSH